MKETLKVRFLIFVWWTAIVLLTLSGLANLVFWFYLGKSIWYHNGAYFWTALWWFLITIPSGVTKGYQLYKQSKRYEK